MTSIKKLNAVAGTSYTRWKQVAKALTPKEEPVAVPSRGSIYPARLPSLPMRRVASSRVPPAWYSCSR